jgi:carboxylate-amine ligase
LPNTGMPTAFDSYAAFDRFERQMLETGSINDRGELWYDVRPHSAHGTVEVRIPDAQHDPDRVLAMTEYVHALVVDLCERYEDGETGASHRRELLDENKWRALRYGHDAELLDRDWERAVPLGALLEREADRLGTSSLLRLYDAGSGATRQRRILDADGPAALCESLLIAAHE